MILSTISKNQLKDVATGEMVNMEDLWKTQACVIIFFRRWGCLFCRLWAKELSEISQLLKNNNIRFIGVGCEEIGLQNFVDGKFFDGELFVDVKKASYEAIGYKRFGYINILLEMFSRESRTAMSKGRGLSLGGDLKGDGLQSGGALVVAAQGTEVLLDFHQERPAHHIPNGDILKVLGLEESKPQEDVPQ